LLWVHLIDRDGDCQKRHQFSAKRLQWCPDDQIISA
jgi:hypothetical protein